MNVDIGNARIAGLAEDLDLDSDRYEWVITAFYIAYICFEWMSVLWKIVPAHIYVTSIVLSWGIVASLQSIATSFASLLVLRTLLGIGEAGFTGIPFYLSFFFKREELALRTGLFISAAPLATSFASTLAWAIIKLGAHSPIASWRLLFLLEGFPSILVAVVVFHSIPDSPSTASYLTSREKKVARLRLRKEKDPSTSTTGKKPGLKWREALTVFTDPKSYLTAFMFFCTNMAFSSLPVFLPTIIKSMGHSALASQALSAPPYLLSFIFVILTAWFSDRLSSRSTFVIFHALLSASGYAFTAIAGGWGTWWRYAGIYPAAIGFFSVITIIITWTINNQESESKQGTGFAMLQLIGQCGPLVGTRLYPDKDAPYYISGMAICAAAMVLVAILALVLRFYLRAKNRKAAGEYGRIGEEGNTLVAKRRGGPKEPFTYML
jgi:MFS family permease